MAVSAASLEAMRKAVAEMEAAGQSGLDMSSLLDDETVFGFVAASARASGSDAADQVEIVARLSDLQPREARRIAGVLAKLGDREVSDRLRAISGRRTKTLKPLQ